MTIQAGDLLLFRISKSSNWFDRLIGWGQRLIHQAPSDADYCHVALVGSDGLGIYEAVWPRIRYVPFDWTNVERMLTIEIYRVKGITPEAIGRVIASARRQVGKRYDALAILTFGYLQIGPALVCSQYVYDCFLDAGIVLCGSSDFESPDDIAASTCLYRVKN